jgi:hypothetical protein
MEFSATAIKHMRAFWGIWEAIFMRDKKAF